MRTHKTAPTSWNFLDWQDSDKPKLARSRPPMSILPPDRSLPIATKRAQASPFRYFHRCAHYWNDCAKGKHTMLVFQNFRCKKGADVRTLAIRLSAVPSTV